MPAIVTQQTDMYAVPSFSRFAPDSKFHRLSLETSAAAACWRGEAVVPRQPISAGAEKTETQLRPLRCLARQSNPPSSYLLMQELIHRWQ